MKKIIILQMIGLILVVGLVILFLLGMKHHGTILNALSLLEGGGGQLCPGAKPIKKRNDYLFSLLIRTLISCNIQRNTW